MPLSKHWAGRVHVTYLFFCLFSGSLITYYWQAPWISIGLRTTLEHFTIHKSVMSNTPASDTLTAPVSKPVDALAPLPSTERASNLVDHDEGERDLPSDASSESSNPPDLTVDRTSSQEAGGIERTGGTGEASEQTRQLSISCNRDSWLTDVCEVVGSPVRVALNSTQVEVFGGDIGDGAIERIRPLARKFDQDVIQKKIAEFQLVPKAFEDSGSSVVACDHVSAVPGILLSAGGHVYSVFHELSDVLIPLFLTAERHHGEVRLLIADCPQELSWYNKYEGFLQMLSNYPILRAPRLLEEGQEPETSSWCFPSLTVGLEAHHYLSIRPEESPGRIGIAKMGVMLARQFGLPVDGEHAEEWADVRRKFADSGGSLSPAGRQDHPLRLGICRREKTRVILNHNRVLQIAREVGFEIEELEFLYNSPSLKEVVRQMRSLDVFFAVHGAAMTHLVFMQPGAVAVQVVPIGLSDTAEVYSVPAMNHLEYLEYTVELSESSLAEEYAREDPVLADPKSVWDRGWAAGAVYMYQNLTLDESQVRDVLLEAAERRSQTLELVSKTAG